MNWKLQYERAEMLRHFQRDLLVGMSHQLRSPIGKQDALLTLIREGWCDSVAEQNSYLLQMQETLSQWMSRWQDFEEMISYPLPITPLGRQSVSMGSLWPPLQTLVLPLARDRRLRFELPSPPTSLTVTGDPQGCVEVGLGLSYWSLIQVLYGEIRIQVTRDPLTMIWEVLGSRCTSEENHHFWTVCQCLVTAMGGNLTTQSGKERLEITWTPRPWDTLESNSLGVQP